MKLREKIELSYDDVLIVPRMSQITSRSTVDISTKICGAKLATPIISSNMDTITGLKMAKKMHELGGLGVMHRYMPEAQQEQVLNQWWLEIGVDGPVSVSVGTLKNDKGRIDATVGLTKHHKKEGHTIICVDIAHGHSQHMLDTIKYIRDLGFTGGLMAGAVCTPEGTRDLLETGADAVRVGVGPGAACSTRIKTGCGYPQLSAIIECAQVGPVIADGGIRTPGDAAKALAAGAKAVMIGGMLAGTDCAPNWSPDVEYMRYRGMASAEAREAFGQKGVNAEGVSVTVPARPEGSTQQVINEISEGIRSAMSYANSLNLSEFYDRAEFVKVTSSVIVENSPHIKNKI